MKIKLFLSALVLFCVFSLTAQVNPNAIGLRFNGSGSHYGSNYGAEISYQLGIGSSHRLELDFGGNSHKYWRHFGVFAGYHWVWNLTEGLNWYIGPGAAIGFYQSRWDKHDLYYDDGGITLSIGGQIGLEYDFNSAGVPLLLSLDARPMWGFQSYYDYDNFGYGAALSLRYTF